MNVYDFSAKSIEGKQVSLSSFKGKVLVVVNTASKCGLTGQYEGLEALYRKYKDQGLEVLGFPCNQFLEQEPGSAAEVHEFCKLRYGVSFPLFEKIDVRGPDAHPLFRHLIAAKPFAGFDPAHPLTAPIQKVLAERYPELVSGDEIKWNFCKFLIDRNGEVVQRFEPVVEPAAMDGAVAALLK